MFFLLETLADLCEIEVKEVIGLESTANDVLLNFVGTGHHLAVLALSWADAVLIGSVLKDAPEAIGSILRIQHRVVAFVNCVWMVR